MKELTATAKAMVAPGRGVLASDESTRTIGKRFADIGVENTEPNRRAYRDLLFSTAGAGDFISGAILFDETLRQASADGTPFPQLLERQGIVPGIKVDTGAKPLAGAPGEKVTEGLDGLRERFEEYYALGARFAKWRAVITIGDGLPSRTCIEANAHALGRYAALSQEQGLVPIVEPEVLMDGAHGLERCYEVTTETLHAVFDELYVQRVRLEGTVLKPNMVIAGTDAEDRPGVDVVARETVRCLLENVPAAVPGIVFLSGGQTEEEATAHLNAMNALDVQLPWELSFSYGRALQQSALQAWKGEPENVAAAQQAFLHRARCNGAARKGEWSEAMEKQAA